MLGQTDDRLREWIGTVLPGVSVTHDIPPEPADKPLIAVYLMDVLSNPSARGTKRPPLQISLRYLITGWSREASEAQRLLVDLLFAAMDQADFEVERNPVPLELWLAFGLTPRPAFFLRVPLRQQRPESATKLVLQPMVIAEAAVGSLQGTIVGPGEVPIADALVEAPSLNLTTRTDYKGRFRFAAVPVQPRAPGLRITAKGRQLFLGSEAIALDRTGNLLVHFKLED